MRPTPGDSKARPNVEIRFSFKLLGRYSSTDGSLWTSVVFVRLRMGTNNSDEIATHWNGANWRCLGLFIRDSPRALLRTSETPS